MQLTFEWDEKKAQENAKKHGVTFDEAKTVFGDPLLWTFLDPDHSRHEERYVSIGLSSEGRTLVVVHTDDERIVRIISGRKAEPKERKRMKKNGTERKKAVPEMRRQYDFAHMPGGVRGKYADAYREGHTVRVRRADGSTAVQYFKLKDGAVLLAPDVRAYFPDSRSVNTALRCLMPLLPRRRRATRAAAR